MTVCNENELPLVLSVNQLAKLLGIGRNVAYKIAKGERLAIRVGEKRLVIPRERFLNYLNKKDC